MSTHAQPKKNRRAAKAVAAAAVGIALLAGGATTFAKWYEEQEIGGGNLQSGHLNFTVANPKWVDSNHGDKTIDPTAFKMVPGDKVTYTATVTPDLVGDNLTATLKVNTANTVTGDLAKIVKVTTKVGGEDAAKQVKSGDSTAVNVSAVIEFPLTTDGAKPADDKSNWWKSQGEDGSVNLKETKVELIQDNNPA
ncbi:alternate-type signal peptide domain-containing protein [Brevibacterium sp. 5221]|uniref:Alternate-type signal peptide domain-containing protein n=1 Tax=Brevibacterium rongguiense TaxID=2695267 RepID=A0A6N9H606_9MICO|nr:MULTISPECIES: alternate-type signal peptide domain-containing protein [Brevibacterium]MYM19468.1 alternate-type signal peptide domain-containing protein [Brevibacterium rongguiense]WAL41194.1 alternate-type signal peptide domain-containing protein [Brevibacterium sp. BRM-1]